MSAMLSARTRRFHLVIAVVVASAPLAACGRATANQGAGGQAQHRKHHVCVTIVQLSPNGNDHTPYPKNGLGKHITTCLPKGNVPQGQGPQGPAKG